MERRRHPRARTLKSARILLNRHYSVIDCTVRNLSPTGACLDVATTLGIPDRFDVMFDSDKSIRPCRLIWHKDKQIGVEFASDVEEEEQLADSA
jgi:PilZ domain